MSDRSSKLNSRTARLVELASPLPALFPPDPKHKLPNGDPYPETVLLRLIDPNGRPSVKLATDVRGGVLYLGGAADPTSARIGADGAEAELFLQNKDGKQRKIQP